METEGQGSAVAAPLTVAQIAQAILASSTSSGDERRLAAWVLDHDEHAEAAIASQARLAAVRDARFQRGLQRAAAAGGDKTKLLAGVAGEQQHPAEADTPPAGGETETH